MRLPRRVRTKCSTGHFSCCMTPIRRNAFRLRGHSELLAGRPITPPIGDANLDSLRSETDPEVVMELLFGTHLLTQQRPRDVLDVIERRGWTRAKPFNPVTAMAIAVAGDAAIADPNRAAALLPGITDFDPLHQPLIAEAVTYSWWRIAKLIPEIGRKELGRIAKLTGADCHDEWIIFVKQAALVALLALECLDQGFEDGLDGRYGPYRTGKWHIFLDIDPLSKSHAAALGANADIVAAAIAQVAEEGRPPLSHNLAPWGPLAPARRVCADHSRTLLVEMAVASSDPPAFVSRSSSGTALQQKLRRAYCQATPVHGRSQLLSGSTRRCVRNQVRIERSCSYDPP